MSGLAEMEARINELASKRRSVGLSGKEEREYKEIVRWQVENKVFASMVGGVITFTPLSQVRQAA